MSKCIDLTGKKFGKLTVIRRVENSENGAAKWECLCDCGNTKIVTGHNLRGSVTQSCGCLIKINNATRTHGAAKTRLYQVWCNMRRRCKDSKFPQYKDYGGRGITVCEEWRDFAPFQEWALSNGYTDDLTIERIDVNGNYEPDNCTWISKKDQANNRRSCVMYEYNGEKHNLTEWCRIYNLPYWTIRTRLDRAGWSFDKAITTPIDVSKRNKKGRKGK